MPSDFGRERGPGFVVFKDFKGGWGRDAARAEHVKISDLASLAFLEAYAEPLREDDIIFPSLASLANYHTCWDAVYGDALGFRCRDGIELSPASLRCGQGLSQRCMAPARSPAGCSGTPVTNPSGPRAGMSRSLPP